MYLEQSNSDQTGFERRYHSRTADSAPHTLQRRPGVQRVQTLSSTIQLVVQGQILGFQPVRLFVLPSYQGMAHRGRRNRVLGGCGVEWEGKTCPKGWRLIQPRDGRGEGLSEDLAGLS